MLKWSAGFASRAFSPTMLNPEGKKRVFGSGEILSDDEWHMEEAGGIFLRWDRSKSDDMDIFLLLLFKTLPTYFCTLSKQLLKSNNLIKICPKQNLMHWLIKVTKNVKKVT